MLIIFTRQLNFKFETFQKYCEYYNSKSTVAGTTNDATSFFFGEQKVLSEGMHDATVTINYGRGTTRR